MTNWNKVKHNQRRMQMGQYREQEVVYALMRSQDYYRYRREGKTVPLTIHGVFKYRFEAEREMEERNAVARSDYWWVKPVLLKWGRILDI